MNQKYLCEKLHTIAATVCPTEPAATKYPKALDLSSVGTLFANM